MEFIFTLFDKNNVRKDVCSRFEDIPAMASGDQVLISYETPEITFNKLVNSSKKEILESMTKMREMSKSVANIRKNSVDSRKKVEVEGINSTGDKVIRPDHYKNFFCDLEWIEAQQHIPTYRDPDVFIAAVELLVRNYLDRKGKNPQNQEYMKALWYMKFLAAYSKVRRPIRINEIESILAS